VYNDRVERDSLRFGKDEKPPYAFCESVHATGTSPWHIRRVVGALKLGGGIDSPSLCKRVDAGKGWDLEARITQHHLNHACPTCVAEYRWRTGSGRVLHKPTGRVHPVLERRDEATLERMLHTNECELGPSEGPMLRVQDPTAVLGVETWIREKDCEEAP
jgi:hypothetical protein